MTHEEHLEDKRAMLLSGTPFGKEELLVGKQLHERIAEMYRSGQKKKEIARLSEGRDQGRPPSVLRHQEPSLF